MLLKISCLNMKRIDLEDSCMDEIREELMEEELLEQELGLGL